MADTTSVNGRPLAELEFEDGIQLSGECKKKIATAVSGILSTIGQNADRSGTADTPMRVANMYDELLSGYALDAAKVLNNALFEVEYDEMVVVKDIDFYSLCEHHMLPFYGKAHVGYLPDKKVVGLSKIPRLVDMFSKRLQVQERMTQQIAAAIDELVMPRGVGVVVEAHHLCAAMRGVKKPGTVMTTSSLRGQFRDNSSTRDEFMSHLRARGGS
ncbi:MAG: GTP cyclohydrolase I FolE [Chloroflexi bacterium]|nr:GTP cyclohydrolase I FolE [Chloroflexota bacterium]